MSGRIAVVACGARKLDRPAPAAQLYTGQYFRACYAAAQVVAPGRVFILSAKHGLLIPTAVVAPYDLRLGQAGSITASQLALQAVAHRVAACQVTALCGARYAELAAHVWDTVEVPLAGLGIGRQLHELSRIARRGEELS
jgi:hypothetical protein